MGAADYPRMTYWQTDWQTILRVQGQSRSLNAPYSQGNAMQTARMRVLIQNIQTCCNGFGGHTKKHAPGTHQACTRHATGIQQGYNRDTTGTQQGCNRDAPGMQQACNMHPQGTPSGMNFIYFVRRLAGQFCGTRIRLAEYVHTWHTNGAVIAKI